MAYEYEYGLKTQFTTPCAVTDTYGTLAAREVVLNDLPRQTRVRPPGLALTALPLQNRKVCTARKFSMWESGLGTYCGIRKSRFYRETRYQIVPVFGIGVIPYPTVAWQNAMRLKIQDDKVSFAETIGEWREAVAVLEGGGDILRKAIKAAKQAYRLRRDRRALKKWFKNLFKREPSSRVELMDAVGTDLAIKFGILPQIALLHDILDKLPEILLRKRRLQVTLKSDVVHDVPSTYERGLYRLVGSKSYRAICYVTYDLDSNGFTAGNPAEALWAGIPVSFLFDWFIDVGSYLSSFNAMKGVNSFGGVLCIREKVFGEDTRTPDIETDAKWYRLTEPGRVHYSSYERQLLGSLPLPALPMPRLPSGGLWNRLRTVTEMLLTSRRYVSSGWSDIIYTD